MQVLIKRGTEYQKAHCTKTFGTTEKDQENANIIIYEGERSLCKDNHRVGKFVVKGLPKGEKGTVHFTISMDIDDNSGALVVTAKLLDVEDEKTTSFTVQSDKAILSDAEVERMIKEAKEMEEADKKMVQYIDLANDFESLLTKLKALARKKRDTDAVKAIVEETYWLVDNNKAKPEDVDDKLKELKDKKHDIESKYSYLLK